MNGAGMWIKGKRNERSESKRQSRSAVELEYCTLLCFLIDIVKDTKSLFELVFLMLISLLDFCSC